MITAISNNFGAEDIRLKDFQKEGLVVLNGMFTFNPSNAEYLAAEVLEIKVPDLTINKSANAAVYLIDIQNEMPHATILKAWVKDCNTICIEPCRCFDSCPALSIMFCSGFVAKNKKADLVFDEVVRPTIIAESGTFKLDSYTGLQHLIVKDNKWGFFSLLFSKFQAAELGQEFTLTVPELPDTMDSYAAIVIGENYQDVGTPVCICHMVGKILHCTPVQKYYNYGNGGRFCISWFVLNDPVE